MRQETGDVAGLQTGFGCVWRDDAVSVKIVEDDVVVKALLPGRILHDLSRIAQG